MAIQFYNVQYLDFSVFGLADGMVLLSPASSWAVADK